MAEPERALPPPPEVTVRLPSGFDGLLRTVEASQRELARTAEVVRVSNEQNLIFNRRSMESIERVEAAVAQYQEVANEIAANVRREAADVVQGRRGDGDGDGGRLLPGGGGEAAPADPATRVSQSIDDILASQGRGGGGRSQAATQNVMDVFQQTRGRPISTLREDLFRRASQRMSETVSTRDQAAVDNLMAEGFGPEDIQAMIDEEGSLLGGAPRMMVMGRNVLGGVSERGFQGGVGALASSLRVPVGAGLAAGAVVGGAHLALNFAENQRRENLVYQSMLGGTNFEGFAERGRERLFRWSQRGVMGGQDAEQLFQGITATGMTGDDRQSALDEATLWHRRFGMSVQESTQLIQQSVEGGTEAFGQLTSALEGVTESAREAGLNAQVARQAFAANLQAVTSVTGGPMSPQLAASMTEAQSGLGRDLEGIRRDVFSEQQLRLLAAEMGVTYNEVIGKLGTTAGQIEVTGVRDERSQRIAGEQLGDRGQAEVAAFVARHRKPGQTNEDAIRDITDEQWRTFAAQELADVLPTDMTATQGVLSGLLGEQMETAAIPQWLARTFAGQGLIGARLEADVQAAEQTSLTESGGMEGVLERLGVGEAEVAERPFSASPYLGEFESVEQRQAALAYKEEVAESGVVNPLVENLLRYHFDPDMRLQVQTKDGERAVSVQEAVRHFQDQIQSGEAVVLTGPSAGQTVSQMLGMQGSGDVTTAEEEAPPGQLGLFGRREVGESLKEFEARRAKEMGEVSGRVIIQPAAGLEELMRFIPEGNVEIQGARYAGEPPPGEIRPAFEGGR